jgi:hypothetical protein
LCFPFPGAKSTRNPYTLVLRKAKNSKDELVAQEQVHKLNNQQEPEEMARRSNEATSMLKMTHTPSLCKKKSIAHCNLEITEQSIIVPDALEYKYKYVKINVNPFRLLSLKYLLRLKCVYLMLIR